MNKYAITTFFCLLSFQLWAKSDSLTIWVNSPTDVQYYAEMVHLYQKQKPSFKAKIVHHGFQELPNKLALAVKTGINTPDIVQIDELFFSIYLPNQIPFLNLTSYVKKSNLESVLLPQRLNLFSYQNKIYGLPQSSAPVVLYYRSDLFKKYRLQPSKLKTWSDLVKMGESVKNKSLYILASDWSYFPILLNQQGGDYINKDGSLNLRSAKSIQTLKFFQELDKKEILFHPDRNTIFDPSFFVNEVAGNQVLCIIGAGWYGLDMIRNYKSSFQQWKALPLPVWENDPQQRRTSSFSGQGLVIYKKSKQPQKAWEFIKFAIENKKANVLRYTMGNSLPASKVIWSDSRLHQPNQVFGGQRFGTLLTELAPYVPNVIQAPNRAIVMNLFREKYWNLLFTGETSTDIIGIINQLEKEVPSVR